MYWAGLREHYAVHQEVLPRFLDILRLVFLHLEPEKWSGSMPEHGTSEVRFTPKADMS